MILTLLSGCATAALWSANKPEKTQSSKEITSIVSAYYSMNSNQIYTCFTYNNGEYSYQSYIPDLSDVSGMYNWNMSLNDIKNECHPPQNFVEAPKVNSPTSVNIDDILGKNKIILVDNTENNGDYFISKTGSFYLSYPAIYKKSSIGTVGQIIATPFTVAFDVVTFPFQIIVFYFFIDAFTDVILAPATIPITGKYASGKKAI